MGTPLYRGNKWEKKSKEIVLMFKYLLGAFEVREWVRMCRALLGTYEISKNIIQAANAKEQNYILLINILNGELKGLQAEIKKLHGVDKMKMQ